MKIPASVGSTLEEELATARAHSELLEAHFDATIEQLPIGIAHADLDDRIVRCNGTFCAMMGRSKQELLGRFFSEITYPEDVDGSIAALRRLWAGSVERYAIDKRYIRKDGTPIWTHVTVAPSRDAHGRMDGAVGIMEDITERKTAEAEVERIHKELVVASRQAGMAEIAANVLHKVGNVLNSLNISATVVREGIRNFRCDTLLRAVSMLQEQGLPAQSVAAAPSTPTSTSTSTATSGEIIAPARLMELLSQFAQHLQDRQRAVLVEMQSLMQFIDHIKDIIATQQTYAKSCRVTELVEVAAVVEDSLRMNRDAFTRPGVMLTRDFQSVPAIVTDRHKVLQILVNLERNATHACGVSAFQEKNVTIRIRRFGESVQIEVIDNGVGIAAEDLGRLFMQGFTTKKDGAGFTKEGHGFGLHSCALAAHDLGGSLKAFSAGVGRGATFTLTLPLVLPERGA
jgi:PAS domain S-box-containing protein